MPRRLFAQQADVTSAAGVFYHKAPDLSRCFASGQGGLDSLDVERVGFVEILIASLGYFLSHWFHLIFGLWLV